MKPTITVEQINDVYLHVYSDDMSIEGDLTEFFKYEIPGARFMPKYKVGLWDGCIKLYDPVRKLLYVGLFEYLKKFAESHECEIQCLNDVMPQDEVSIDQITEYVNSLNLHGHGQPITIRDYQLNAIHTGLNTKRCVLLSPTGSGKSLIIYSLCRWLIEKQDLKCIVVVPTTSLVEQLYSDFEDYSAYSDWIVRDNCCRIYKGKEKDPVNVEIILENQQVIYLPGSQNIKTLNRGTVRADSLVEGDDLDEAYIIQFTGI